jgi:NTP pyrophosphatase (non-canonical NTP hydrolase)
MTLNEYQTETLRTAGSADRIMTALGLAGETGEYVELVKKWAFHGRELSRDEAAAELGDVLWYASVAAHANGLTLEEVATRNVAKLRARYPGGFEPGGGLR